MPCAIHSGDWCHETVPANTIFFIQRIRNSVHIGMFGHGLMKSRIENRHLRNLWQQVADSKNTRQIRRIVKGSYFYTSFNISYHFVGNYHTGVKFFAPCTTRCPTASISSMFLIQPCLALVSTPSMYSIAS